MTSNVFWKVVGVFDPYGQGGDFSYTVGMGVAGLPELHMWARPTHGQDVGADFKLSQSDMLWLLNGFGLEWCAGDLKVGDERVVKVDGGLTTLTFTVAEPVSNADLHANLATAETVAGIRWSLERPPVGEDPGLGGSEQQWARRLGSALERLTPVAGLPPLPAQPSFATDQDFGPLTPWVLAAAHSVGAADGADVAAAVLETLDQAHVPVSLGELAVLGRSVGRVDALRDVGTLARDVGLLLAGQGSWRDIVSENADDLDMPPADLSARLRELVTDAVGLYLQTAVMNDVVTEDVRARSMLPFENITEVVGL